MSTDEQGYNGWTNYETWCVNLHLTNDPYTADELARIVDEDTEYSCGREDNLREFVYDVYNMDELQGPVGDFVMGAMGRVNWREIIENHQDDNS